MIIQALNELPSPITSGDQLLVQRGSTGYKMKVEEICEKIQNELIVATLSEAKTYLGIS